MISDIAYKIAFISLSTSDEELYKKTIKFYHSLGFESVKIYDKFKNHDNMLLSSGVSQDSIKETWLESFKLGQIDESGSRIPQQDASNHNQSGGLLLKLRLVSKEISIVKGSINLIYYSVLLNEILNKFPECDKKSENEVSLVDPLGNELLITSYLNPMSINPIDKGIFLESKNDISEVKDKIASNHLTSPKKKIAIMTSGGDSPGMNSVVRAVVRAGIYYGCDVYAVYEGYEGLLKGGKLLKKMNWYDVRGWLSEGGTLIGTARCMNFKKREYRKIAARNLISEGIDALVVCGGDGSLTGADLFRSEWPSLVTELVADGIFTEAQVAPYKHLNIVGLVGSIDNDMSGTDSTIGAYSALERICEMVDYINATAKSHSRAFVIEVMGRHCGWLALMAGIATGADYIFIPERAAPSGKWQKELKEVCQRHRNKGQRNNTVIVAEGALDDQLNPITSEQVKIALSELGLDTKITTLGHVQRGGTAVAHDRWLATLQGVEAVKAILEMTPETPSPLIGIKENKIIRIPLVESVALTKQVAIAIESKDFDKAISLRDSEFKESYDNFVSTTVKDNISSLLPEDERLNIAIVHVGAPSAALNAATRAATLSCLEHGYKPLAIMNGFSGLIQTGEVKELKWIHVENWHNLGGSEIGTNRTVAANDLGTIAYYFQKYKLDGLIIMGGFEGFKSLKQLRDGRSQYPIFNIPMVLIPSTVSNNVPGTEYSLGADTCLNSLVKYIDAIKQSASATRRRVFVVEVQGGYSGYIASYTGLVTGAVSVCTPEDKIDLSTIKEDLLLLKEKFNCDNGENRTGKILIRNEQASSIYSTQLLADIISESSEGKFEVRAAIPGHVQQGGVPSSKDRVIGSRFAIKCVKFIETWNKNNICGDEKTYPCDHKTLRFRYVNGEKVFNLKDEDSSAAVICVNGSTVSFKPIADLWDNETNVTLRKGHEIHWKQFGDIVNILSGRSMFRDRINNCK